MQVKPLLTNSGIPFDGSQQEVPQLFTPRVVNDERGFFFESWNQRTFPYPVTFVQDNHSRSSRGVIRGLHYQLPPHAQAKLVRCVVGEILDVAVDLRRSSSTFAHWVSVRLDAVDHQQLWVPEGFAHGFLSLSNPAEVLYKTTDFWSKECERTVFWDDPQLDIFWEEKLKFSAKDAAAPLLTQCEPGDLFP